MKKKLYVKIFGLLSLLLAYLLFANVSHIYRNAAGEQMAVDLAHSIQKFCENNEGSLQDFLTENAHFYRDKRGNQLQIHLEQNEFFEISYQPKTSWLFALFVREPQELKISWRKGDKEIEIESSIKKP